MNNTPVNLSRTLWASCGVLLQAIAHHIYGAILYNTPFRLHITYYAVPILFLLILAYYIYLRKQASLHGKISLWVFIIVSVLVPIIIFGIIEGGYNHLVKNILFFGGTSQARLDDLFPPPSYEMPNDFWFEATGVLQFFIGIYAAYYIKKLVLSIWSRTE